MATGLQDQIERRLSHSIRTSNNQIPWRQCRGNYKFGKLNKHRRERRRAKQDPECLPQYRRYNGWEY